MSKPKTKPPVLPQAIAFQRFTIRLVNGKFVRVPKSDLPSTEAQVDKTLTSNQTEIRELFRRVNGRFVAARSDPLAPAVSPDIPLPDQQYPDPSFDLPQEPPLPARDSSFIQENP